MPTVWGQLPKSAEDNETIEEAIARLIDDHDDDPEAHLAAGGSLSEHKGDEIIDHPARSVPVDKFAAYQLYYSTNFENGAAFAQEGSPSFVWPGFNMHPDSGGFSSRDEVWMSLEERGLFYNVSEDMLFQFCLYGEQGSNAGFRLMFGGYAKVDDDRGIGLTIQDGVAKFFFAKLNGDSVAYLDWSGFEETVHYVVRIEYVAGDEKAYFYVDDELIGSLDCPLTSQSDYFHFSIQAYNTTAGQCDFNITALAFQGSPNE